MAEIERDAKSLDAFEERMRKKMLSYTAPDPSPRNRTISKDSSHPDRIEAGYQADGHKTWGFVIYRTTYDSDTDWTEFIRRLHVWTKDSMDFYNGQDVLHRMTWTIFDDRERFDGADVATIRQHFRDWAEATVQSEQRTGETGNAPVSMGYSPRYKYCVQVDAEALKSVVQDSPPPPEFDLDRQGWVKVIDKSWLPRSENTFYAGRPLVPDEYEPVEGVTEQHVGCVKCPLPSVTTEYYMLFRDPSVWSRSYRRPPAVIG